MKKLLLAILAVIVAGCGVVRNPSSPEAYQMTHPLSEYSKVWTTGLTDNYTRLTLAPSSKYELLQVQVTIDGNSGVSTVNEISVQCGTYKKWNEQDFTLTAGTPPNTETMVSVFKNPQQAHINHAFSLEVTGFLEKLYHSLTTRPYPSTTIGTTQSRCNLD